MTTTYYTFRTRRVKVSGGADLMTLVPIAQSNPISDQAPPRAEILDFNFCRSHQETQQAWKALTDAARSDRLATEAPAEEAEHPAAPTKLSLHDRIELLASAAVITTALSAAAVLLSSL